MPNFWQNLDLAYLPTVDDAVAYLRKQGYQVGNVEANDIAKLKVKLPGQPVSEAETVNPHTLIPSIIQGLGAGVGTAVTAPGLGTAALGGALGATAGQGLNNLYSNHLIAENNLPNQLPIANNLPAAAITGGITGPVGRVLAPITEPVTNAIGNALGALVKASAKGMVNTVADTADVAGNGLINGLPAAGADVGSAFTNGVTSDIGDTASNKPIAASIQNFVNGGRSVGVPSAGSSLSSREAQMLNLSRSPTYPGSEAGNWMANNIASPASQVGTQVGQALLNQLPPSQVLNAGGLQLALSRYLNSQPQATSSTAQTP